MVLHTSGFAEVPDQGAGLGTSKDVEKIPSYSLSAIHMVRVPDYIHGALEDPYYKTGHAGVEGAGVDPASS